MYPDLSYFFHDVFGTPYDNWTSVFKTFGFLLALAFLGSAYVLRLELKRKEKEGILKPIVKSASKSGNKYLFFAINVILGFFIGFKLLYIIQDFETFKVDPAGIILSTKGNLIGGIIFGILSLAYYYYDLKKREKYRRCKEAISSL
ncbi:MAG: hypothetical protein R2771_14740 [Saprospiraceae bacterium]